MNRQLENVSAYQGSLPEIGVTTFIQMKHIALLTLLLSWCAGAAQNLVVDPSFEELDSLPDRVSQIERSRQWSTPNRATPDYYHSGSGYYPCHVPYNMAGKQWPHSGLAYVGIITQANDLAYSELVQGRLSEPLKKGAYYKVSYYVSLACISKFVDHRLGAFFSADSISSEFRTVPAQERGHTVTAMKVPECRDVDSWQLVTGMYKAKGDEKFIVFGNVTGSVGKVKLKKNRIVRSQAKDDMSYYYIDDVTVVKARNRNDSAFDRREQRSQHELKPGPALVLAPCKVIFREGTSAFLDAKEINAAAKQDTGSVPGLAMLDYLTNFLLQDPEVSIEVGVRHGPIDDAGAALALTQARALAIVRRLVEMGVPKDHLVAVGHGSALPTDSPPSAPFTEVDDGRIEIRITAVDTPSLQVDENGVGVSD